ncbi:MAG: tetratricopeptide repeat protein, partial [Armatimonadetes bacterium]|nr:tetratricopeptide repeat protein [Armatimonadota bacterium]
PLKALGFYQQAQKKEPSNPKVLLGLARAFYDLDRRDEALKAYGTLKGVDPETAAKFDYLEVKGQDATRAADVSAKGVMTWVEE